MTATARLLAVAALFCVVLPAQARGNKCLFEVKGLSMSFGALIPSSGIQAVAPLLGIKTAGDCSPGQAMVISADNGLNYNGTRNLKSGSGQLIRYSLNGLPQMNSGPGNGNYVPFNFSGVIIWADYADASAGLYSDSVIISVDP